MNDKPENEQGSLPISPPSPDKERAKKKAAEDEKIIIICACAGFGTFYFLHPQTGVVPGGWLGGAAGGALGAIVGTIINSLRK